MNFGNYLGAWAASMAGAPQPGQPQPPPVQLPDFMAGINRALAENKELGADKQAALQSAAAGIAKNMAQWQQEREAGLQSHRRDVANSQAAAEAAFAQGQQAHAARLNMQRRQPSAMMGFGLQPRPYFGGF